MVLWLSSVRDELVFPHMVARQLLEKRITTVAPFVERKGVFGKGLSVYSFYSSGRKRFSEALRPFALVASRFHTEA